MTATVEERALLAAILAQPDEDTPRLVYADWLQENGRDARAEFIRVQIRIEREPSFREPEADPLRRREERLIQACGYTWCDGLIGAEWKTCGMAKDGTRVDAVFFQGDRATSVVGVQFGRGFVESVTCTAADWLAHGDAVRAAHPVERVTLTTPFEWDGDEDAAWLVGDPKQTHVPWTDIRAEASPEEHDRRHLFPALLRLRWPRIAFALPA